MLNQITHSTGLQYYRFGPWIFNSDLGTLEKENHSESLDPRIADLLHLFLQHPGKLFSRDELLDTVWQGTVVSDNSVSWAISQLRKALNDEAKSPLYLETMPKKGYRFIAQVSSSDSAVPEQSQAVEIPSQLTSKSSVKVIAVVAILTLLLVIIQLFLNLGKTKPAEIVDAKLVTAMDGVEKSAAVSPDGLILAFVLKAPAANNFTVWLKPLKENRQFNETKMDGTVLPDKVDSSRDVPAWQLLEDDFSYEQILWGQDAYNLIAVKVRNSSSEVQKSCHIVQLKLDLSRKSVLQLREIISCHSGGATHISFNRKAGKLYFTDQRKDDNAMVLYEYDVENDELTMLHKADETGGGIHFIDYNPVNNKLLYLQDINWRSTRFATFSLTDNAINTLFTQEAIYYSAWWGIAPDTIWLNWGNENVLEYNIAKDTSEFILKSSFGWNFNLKPAGSNTVTFEVSDANGADFTIFKNQRWYKSSTSFTESSAAYSPDTGRLAFVSNQNGLPQIWIKDSQYEAARQLSSATEFREIQYLSWSQDESRIIGVSENFVGQLNLKEPGYQALLNNGVAPYWPKLSPDNQQVLVSHFINNQWRLYLYPVQDKPVTQTEIGPYLVTDGYIGEFLDDQTLIFSRHQQDGLFKLDLQSNEESILWPDLPAGGFWQLYQQQLVYRDGELLKSVSTATLKDSNTINATSQTVVHIPDGLSNSFDIHPLTGEVLFLDYRRTQSDIKIATYQYE